MRRGMREHILDCAIDLFLEKGYQETSTNDIRQKVGNLSRGGLYHHFSKKEDILEAIPNYLLESNDEIQQVLKDESMSGLAKLRALIINVYKNTAIPTTERKFFHLLSDPNFMQINTKNVIKNTIPLYEQLILLGNADGTMAVKYPYATAETTVLLLNSLCQPSYRVHNSMHTIEVLTVTFNALGIPLVNEELKNILVALFESIQGDKELSSDERLVNETVREL